MLDRFSEELNGEGETAYPTHIFMICGSDLLDSFNVPGLWSEEDMKIICSHGISVVQREGNCLCSYYSDLGQVFLLLKYQARIQF